jgi:glycosyltransferase involved in cell wall biosynthesis
MPAVVFLVQRIGPYHHARLSAFAARATISLTVVEFRPHDEVYEWSPVPTEGGYLRIQAHSRYDLCRILDELGAEVVVCTGYSDPEVHHAVAWALNRGIPLVTCSDSTFQAEPRLWLREAFKRRVVAAFDSALVAGRRAQDYIGTLGIREDRCFKPWDVVDNAHFERGADLTRANADAARQKLGLPRHYFLCVARFLWMKNLATLIDAFALYSQRVGHGAWSLVLSGSGPLEAELRAQASKAGVADRVYFPGFLQYEDLPACYGLAGTLVLPSTSDTWGLVVNEAMAAGLPVLVSSLCGCAPDLVREGDNGFTFDAKDTRDLEACLTRTAAMEPSDRERMGERSRQIIAAYTPEAFADGLGAAVACAISRKRGRSPWHTRTLLHLLGKRATGRS